MVSSGCVATGFAVARGWMTRSEYVGPDLPTPSVQLAGRRRFGQILALSAVMSLLFPHPSWWRVGRQRVRLRWRRFH